ncbi:MAG: single-stranded-DNA-specific exonuclease RecJ [Chitinophagales bacterium]|nr:single-stranded-DNA-specific exonuclease RecJ [Chitinophagales bacterium]
MEKSWVYKPIDREKLADLQESLKINPILLELLIQRGITTYQEAKDFFRPQLDMLHDPFLMKDMDKAVTRIKSAIENKERILVYGDYDVDGTTSVALFYQFIHDIYSNVDYYIPDRYAEGYGVSMKGMDYAIESGVGLIVSLDCGITAFKAVEYAKENNIDFIICDHHLPSDILPKAVAVLDAKRKDCAYPFKELSGCGVGFKLCSAIASQLDMPSETYMQYIDLVAVSIASDIVSITGENRVLAFYGLEKLNKNPVLGLKILKKIAGIELKDMSISDIVFSLGPRINAPGRMAHARASVDILTCTNEEEGLKFAESLSIHNSARRETDEQITSEAIFEISNVDDFSNQRTIVLANESWSKGVIGIVASRMVERYYKPTIIFSEKDGILTGSARSIRGFSIYDGISKCAENVIQFGGHDFAAGLSIEKGKLEAFKAKFEEIAVQEITQDMQSPVIEIDHDLSLKDIDFKFYNILEQMAPFGPDNMQPVFATKNLRDAGNTRKVGKTLNHVRMEMIDQNGVRMNGIAFGLGDFIDIEKLKSSTFDICYTIQANEFNGKISLDMIVKDIKLVSE